MMELPMSQSNFSGTLLMLVMSSLLLWDKAASIPACLVEEDSCWNPLLETFNSAIQRSGTLRNLADQFYVDLSSLLIRRDEAVLRAGTYCHSILTKPPNSGTEHMSIEIEEYLKTLINFVGSWISPLYHLVIELSAMKDVPQTLLSKAKEIEENNRLLLDDIRWIFTKVYPTAEIKEEFASWERLSFLKSSSKNYKFLAMFNLSNCLDYDAKYTLFHLRILKCRITGKDCLM